VCVCVCVQIEEIVLQSLILYLSQIRVSNSDSL